MVHQNSGSLTTTVCFRVALPLHRATLVARAAHLSVAFPLHDCGANLLHCIDFARQIVHHHPARRRRMRWPPWLGSLAVVLVNLRV